MELYTRTGITSVYSVQDPGKGKIEPKFTSVNVDRSTLERTPRVEFRKPDRARIKPGSRLKQHFSFQKGSSSRDQLSRP